MGLFKSIESAKVNQGGVYFNPGKYLVEVIAVKTIKSRKNMDLYIVECEILDSDVADRPTGSRASWVVNLAQDAAMGNIKAFLAAANGIDPSDEDAVQREITEEVADLSYADENPVAGVKLGLQVTLVKTRAGTDFSRHFWSVYEGEAAASA